MNFKEYIKHLSIVILGILIAFWIGKIGARYQDNNTKKQVLLTILSELKENNESLNESIVELKGLNDTFKKIQKKEVDINDITLTYSQVDISSIGYETAKYTGILKDVNYKLASKIVSNYEDQISLKEFDKILVEEFLRLIRSDEIDETSFDYAIILIYNHIDNISDFEKEQKELISELEILLKVKE